MQVALRADTDALPMAEGNHHLPYRSRRQGAAHMCGHDGHVAALVAAAALLAARLDRIPQV
jgi:hippurate hydrolase